MGGLELQKIKKENEERINSFATNKKKVETVQSNHSISKVTTESKPPVYSWNKTETPEVHKPVETKTTYSWNKTDNEVKNSTESKPKDDTKTEPKSSQYTWKKTETGDSASASANKETLK